MILEKIESTAENVLNQLKLSVVPVPVEEVASKLNIKIGREPSDDFSGLLIRKDGKALIGVNSTESHVRQRFTIAHELGHFFLHPKQDSFVDYRDNNTDKKDIRRSPREKQANAFAAALLMPRSKLIKDVKVIFKQGIDESDIAKLAEKYEVSEEAMKYRLMNLHLIHSF
ncbi:MAG: hypothetical protein COY01_02925 [Candidatus Pacebacteria bacterium CG_4_10_14_0_2_um_filter_40_20]|nr:MAG: hypothetical protein COY01_02925 [Candidatus Pacebacteria bacterium CG_4_10_14_0_2_um_filter_40_20]